MSTARYFQDELDSLRRSGEEFSKYFPKLTNYLSDRSTDPDVERLLEGFAFLTARLREKLDDQLPEVTQSLLTLLWPNFLRPVPSMTIMQFNPVAGAINSLQRLEEGVEVESVKVDGTTCRFRTSHAIDIHPLKVSQVHHEVSKEASVIEIDISTLAGESIGEMDLDRLRLWLGGSDYSAMTLNLWLHRYLRRMSIRNGAGVEITLGKECLQQGGLSDDEKVLPYPDNAFSGYRLLQEYYTLPRKFCVIDILNLVTSHLDAEEGSFRLTFETSRPLPPDVRIGTDSFLLNCVPAINLFEQDGEPILMTGRQTEYPVLPSRRGAGEIEVYAIENVTGWHPSVNGDGGDSSGSVRTYARFESFVHEVERVENREAIYFHEHVRQSISGEKLDRLISFVREDEIGQVNQNETISLALLCTNGSAPEELALDDICVPGYSAPSFARPTNVTRPTAALYPVVDGTLQWQLISALSLNYQSLQSADALRSILRVFDFGARIDRQREREAHQRLLGIEGIQTQPVDRLFRGLPVRGMCTVLEMRESNFGCEGEMYLFATVLADFFALYATINSFHELTVRGLEAGEEYRWTARIGNQPLI